MDIYCFKKKNLHKYLAQFYLGFFVSRYLNIYIKVCILAIFSKLC